MNQQKKLIPLIFILTLSITKCNNTISPEIFNAISFDEGMGFGRGFYELFLKTKTINFISSGRHAVTDSAQEFVEFFKEIYEKNKHYTLPPYASQKIPKKIHQIWIGSPLPKKYHHLIQTWKDKNPDYEYKLWTDQEINALPMQNKDLYNKVRNYGEKADIARYEILHKEGGIYIDIDYECFNSLDILLTYDFFAGLRPFRPSYLAVANGLIGVTPNHPFIKKILDELPHFRHHNSVLERTGPVFLTKLIYKFLNTMPGANIVLPSIFLLPLGNPNSVDEFATCASIDLTKSFAHHYWHANWCK